MADTTDGVPTEPRATETLAEHVADGRDLAGATLVLATHNEGKLREFRGLCEPFDVSLISCRELDLTEPEETGATFEANAVVKAATAMEASGKPALSDDSGLVIAALDGEPGVRTADWATTPEGTRDFDMAMRKVEDALRERGATRPEQRRASFVSVLCLAWPDGTTEEFRGEVAGTLVWPPRGERGFGFDPVFAPDGHDRTFGEMDENEKHGWRPGEADALSHRARAFKAFAERRLLMRVAPAG